MFFFIFFVGGVLQKGSWLFAFFPIRPLGVIAKIAKVFFPIRPLGVIVKIEKIVKVYLPIRPLGVIVKIILSPKMCSFNTCPSFWEPSKKREHEQAR